MSNDPLWHKPDDPGFIIAWKYKYEFEVGKMTDKTMTYGEAHKKAEELCEQNQDKTYWPEEAKEVLENRFFDPNAH